MKTETAAEGVERLTNEMRDAYVRLEAASNHRETDLALEVLTAAAHNRLLAMHYADKEQIPRE